METAGPTNELKLIGDPTRSRILASIAASPDGRQLVGSLAVLLGLRQPTVSHHVKALFEAGLLERRPEGRFVWYSIRADRAERISQVLHDTPQSEVTDGVLERISADLSTRFAGRFAPETIARYVRESHSLLAAQGQIPRRLPSLTSRFAAERLSALAAQGVPASRRPPEVLFVCVENAGRSQMAAGILRQLAGERVRVRTAGSRPAGAVHSVVVTALDEIGVPVGGEYPKPLTDEVVRAADVVVTMGCGDACPVFPGRLYLDWEVGDPAGLGLEKVRGIRDDIESRVRGLLGSLPASRNA